MYAILRITFTINLIIRDLFASYTSSGDIREKDPPVPIPNTEVKLFFADDTWLETVRQNRALPEHY